VNDLRFRGGSRFRRAMTSASGSVTYGLDVVEDLRAGVNEFAEEVSGATAIGCVGWLSDKELVTALRRLDACCIVVNKPDRDEHAQQSLLREGNGLLASVLPALADLQRRRSDGGRQILGPLGPIEEIELEPVRVAGYRAGDRARPLLHAKLLVLGTLTWNPHASGLVVGESPVFLPRRCWMGSANWTLNARRSLEVGWWSEDPEVLAESTAFLSDVLAISEPLGSNAPMPEPELLPVEFDDDAMVEAIGDELRDDFDDR
jgi:hypothetical protein